MIGDVGNLNRVCRWPIWLRDGAIWWPVAAGDNCILARVQREAIYSYWVTNAYCEHHLRPICCVAVPLVYAFH